MWPVVLNFALWCGVGYFANFVSPTLGIPCQGTARYTLNFTAEWTRTSHGDDFPSSAHFSPLIGCSHDASYVMWKPGILATAGVKSVAELGAWFNLILEMNQQEDLKTLHRKYSGSGIGSGAGTAQITNIEVNTDYPLVSFITMIAPSPDWFVGVHDFDLCDTTSGKWLPSKSRDLLPYDAGTDSGPDFGSDDLATNPPEKIHLLTKDIPGSFHGLDPLRRFGTFTFVKTFDSNPPPIQQFYLSPNIKTSVITVFESPLRDSTVSLSTSKLTNFFTSPAESILPSSSMTSPFRAGFQLTIISTRTAELLLPSSSIISSTYTGLQLTNSSTPPDESIKSSSLKTPPDESIQSSFLRTNTSTLAMDSGSSLKNTSTPQAELTLQFSSITSSIYTGSHNKITSTPSVKSKLQLQASTSTPPFESTASSSLTKSSTNMLELPKIFTSQKTTRTNSTGSNTNTQTSQQFTPTTALTANADTLQTTPLTTTSTACLVRSKLFLAIILLNIWL